MRVRGSRRGPASSRGAGAARIPLYTDADLGYCTLGVRIEKRKAATRVQIMAYEPFHVAEGSEYPLARQISVFLENRLGQLLRLTRLFDDSEVHILGLSVETSVDCAILRLLFDDPDKAHEVLTDARFAITESEVLVVELPPGKRGIMTVCTALISGEININYIYPLLPGRDRAGCLAIQVDNPAQAVSVLRTHKFRVLDQSEL